MLPIFFRIDFPGRGKFEIGIFHYFCGVRNLGIRAIIVLQEPFNREIPLDSFGIKLLRLKSTRVNKTRSSKKF